MSNGAADTGMAEERVLPTTPRTRSTSDTASEISDVRSSAEMTSMESQWIELERAKLELERRELELRFKELTLRTKGKLPCMEIGRVEHVDPTTRAMSPGVTSGHDAGRNDEWRPPTPSGNAPVTDPNQPSPPAVAPTLATAYQASQNPTERTNSFCQTAPRVSFFSGNQHPGYSQWQQSLGAENSGEQTNRGFGATMATGDMFGKPHSSTMQTSHSVTERMSLTQAQKSARELSRKENIPKFYGDARHWPMFIARFQSSTALCGYTDDENLIRLADTLRGPAYDAVEHLLLLPGGLEETLRTLRVRFGRPDLIIDAMVEQIRRLPPPRAERLESIVEYGSAVRNLCATIKITGLKEYECNVTLLRELTARLPSTMRLDWALRKQSVAPATLLKFGEWLSELADAVCGEISSNYRAPHSDDGKERSHLAKRSARLNTHVEAPARNKCAACSGPCERITDCTDFLAMSKTARNHVVRKANLCRNCLRLHRGSCRAQGCSEVNCGGRHHALLHEDREHDGNDVRRQPRHEPDTRTRDYDTARNTLRDGQRHTKPSAEGHTHRYNNTHLDTNGTLLRYVPIMLIAGDKQKQIYALIDDGSATTLMEHGLVNELGLRGTPRPLCLQWTGDTVREETDSVEVSMTVAGIHNSKRYKLSNVHTVRTLSLPAQTVSMEQLADRYAHLSGIPAASYKNIRPQMLIGVQHCNLFKTTRFREGRWGEPVAAKCRLGWTVFGPVSSSPASYLGVHVCHSTVFDIPDGRIDEALREHFSIESLGITAPERTLLPAKEERALQLLKAHTRPLTKRYETGLLWRHENISLPASKAMALRRHNCLMSKMRRDPVLAQAIKKTMKSYEEKGYIRRLTLAEVQVKTPKDWYLPIFPVSNPNKPGKIRMVFDAAAKSNGVSLNDMLLSGPDQLATLIGVLHKFREGRVAVVGDIREMFFQVRMREEDQRSQMFLWLGDDEAEAPSTYVVTVMTFGATCSPGSANFVKNTNADRWAELFPRAAQCIKYEHYVDDMLASVESENEALSLAKDVRHVHAQAGFEIRNWLSNSNHVLKELKTFEEKKDTAINLCSDSTTEKVLGMWWDTKSDSFTFRLSPHHDTDLLNASKLPTKREVLRTLMKVWLGLIGNFLMGLKIVLQDAWRSGRQWDDKLDGDVEKGWYSWVTSLPLLQEVSIPRCYRRTTPPDSEVQLHVFCDAGEGGMAAVAYFRFKCMDIIECALIGSKTRVTPLKPTSVPRLELQAAVIGARFAEHIITTHRVKVSQRVFWTDSRNVLCWLRSDHRRYTPFVAFRIGELLETTNVTEWRWIPSASNVADEGTKWRKAPSMKPTSRWFQGPSFMWQNEEAWPESINPEHTPEELRRTSTHHSVANGESPLKFANFSRWKRLLRTTAYVIRFMRNARKRLLKENATTDALTRDELAAAEQLLFKQIQREAFPAEVKQLKQPEPTTAWSQRVRKESPLHRLTPELDEHGVIRMRGRLSRCPMVAEALQKPVILPRRHHATDLLINDFHERYCHINHRTVVSEIRSKYYIPKLLVEHNRIRRRCQLCRIWNAEPKAPLMGNIPHQRVAVSQRPFTYCGVDYFGPMNVLVGRRTEKRWGVLFTCLTVRAVHMEIVPTLTTSSCISAVRRFIASRGRPREFISDRGTNFVGAARELSTAFNSPAMQWTFNPPGAPHFGGCWERLVGSVKRTLERMELQRVPTEEVLFTALKEVEMIINSRPLTYLPLDDEESDPITPNHILLGSSNGDKPPATFDDSAAAVRSSWKTAQRYADQFWRLWVKEYLPTLTRRAKWFEPVAPLKVGDVVIVTDNNLPRSSWPKGRIINVKQAQDGQVRRATIKTIMGVYERPTTKIARLDVGKTTKLDNEALPQTRAARTDR